MKLTAHEAIEFAEAHGLGLNKYADPIEEAREGLSPDEAREIAREDPTLIWIETNPAAVLGRKGGAARSERKATSSRANGAKGGRPAGRTLYTVTVRECNSEGREQTTCVYAIDADEAFLLGMRKIYGKKATFQQDSGLQPGYGQVFEPVPGQPMAHNAITGRVRVTVD